MWAVEVSNNDGDCNKEIVKLECESFHQCDDQGEKQFVVEAAEHQSQVGSQEYSKTAAHSFLPHPPGIVYPRPRQTFPYQSTERIRKEDRIYNF